MQGFASGDLERDATAIRLFADAGLELLLAQVNYFRLWPPAEQAAALESLLLLRKSRI